MPSSPACGGLSAAQKRTLLQVCSKCGAVNSENAEVCYVCDLSLVAAEEELEPVAVPSSEPEWRLEVAHRLESYRARRRRGRPLPDDSQTALPFVIDPAPSGTNGASSPERHAPRSTEARPSRNFGIEIAVAQPSLDFVSGEQAHPSAPLIPVAEINERSRAGVLDALFLIGSYTGFLVLFGSLGGQITIGKLDSAVYGITFFLLYAQYFTLFTFFDGSTPGMRLRGLRVVGFDGNSPRPGQLLWRSFGYLLSAGALFLGFLWALWDEDRLTWQDRISQTYVTQTPDDEESI